MSEVEKLYSLAGLEKKEYGYCDWDSNCPYPHHKCNDECPYWKYEDEAIYPPFTAEKQLKITKLIGLHYGFKFIKNEAMDYMISTDLYNNLKFDKQGYGYGFDEAIANLIINLWHDLTEAEQNEIKNILKGE